MDKMQVNTAITDNTKLDLSHQHITSIDFMELQPSMYKEMVPGEKLSVNMESFSRLNPLPVPTFGRASMRHRAFFVPYRTIFRGWNDFITDAVHVPSSYSSASAIVSSVPLITNAVLVAAFTNYAYPTAVNPSIEADVETAMESDYFVYPVLTTAPTDPHDLEVTDGTNTAPYNLTIQGRQALKIVESLGYKILWSIAKNDSNMFYNETFSALPLLALAKVYTDWYFPNQYTNLADYDELVSLCNQDSNANTFVLSAAQVHSILNLCTFVQYDSDMFTAAWDEPNQPSSGTYSEFRLVNIDTASKIVQRFNGGTSNIANNNIRPGYVTNNPGDANLNNNELLGYTNAPFISPLTLGTLNTTSTYTTAPTSISQYLLHSLHALTDYMKRHQLVGSKAADRYLARFGKSLAAEKLNRSIYLGAHMQDIQIGDIMSTADTDSANLGAYAGKGLSYGTGHFEFDTDEFGLFIIMTSLVPSVGYFQGIDRNVKHTSKLSYFTPEFDSLGSQAIGADELFVPSFYTMSDYPQLPQKVFGYLPTYYEYKVKKDNITGNFRLNSINGAYPGSNVEFNAANSWHLMRTFDELDFATVNDISHSPSFITGRSDASQYKRIFYDVKASAPDNFTVIHNFDVASYSPMHSLFDSYEFEDKGKKITEDVNGVKMN